MVDGSVTEVKEVQPWKMLCPRYVMVGGKVIFVREVQC